MKQNIANEGMCNAVCTPLSTQRDDNSLLESIESVVVSNHPPSSKNSMRNVIVAQILRNAMSISELSLMSLSEPSQSRTDMHET